VMALPTLPATRKIRDSQGFERLSVRDKPLGATSHFTPANGLKTSGLNAV
jgi:hypothetical protein